MLRLVALSVVGLVVVLPTPVRSQQPQPAKPAATAKEIADDLREARKLLAKITDKETREKLELILTRNELRATDLEKLLTGRPVAKPQPASAEDFAKVLAALKKESFDDGKVKFVESLGKARFFSCEQVKDLLKSFSFDDNKVKAGAILYGQGSDPENFFVVYDVFSFESSKQALRDKVKGK